MTKVSHDAMTNTYRVEKDDGSFDSYSAAQYKEKFGKTPEPVEDVTDVVEDENLSEGSSTGSDENEIVDDPEKVDKEEETVTSVDGSVTVPGAEVETGQKAFEDLSSEEQAEVKRQLAEGASVVGVGGSSSPEVVQVQDTNNTGLNSDNPVTQN